MPPQVWCPAPPAPARRHQSPKTPAAPSRRWPRVWRCPPGAWLRWWGCGRRGCRALRRRCTEAGDGLVGALSKHVCKAEPNPPAALEPTSTPADLQQQQQQSSRPAAARAPLAGVAAGSCCAASDGRGSSSSSSWRRAARYGCRIASLSRPRTVRCSASAAWGGVGHGVCNAILVLARCAVLIPAGASGHG